MACATRSIRSQVSRYVKETSSSQIASRSAYRRAAASIRRGIGIARCSCGKGSTGTRSTVAHQNRVHDCEYKCALTGRLRPCGETQRLESVGESNLSGHRQRACCWHVNGLPVTPSERRLAIPRTDVTTGAPLSFAQQRLWFLDQLTPNSSIYNIPLIVDLEGPLDVEALCRAIREIARRHDSLRTTFPSHRGIPHQAVQSADAFMVPIDDMSRCDVESRDAEVDAAIAEEARRPFDLAHGPIFRMRLVRLGREQHVLVGAVHHLVFDAWSTGIFFRELTTLYRAFCAGEPSPLPDLPVRYVDFSAWQRDNLQGEHLRRELDYWKEHLKVPPRLAWPTDLRRPARQSFQGARAHLVLPEDLMAGVEAFSRREGVTLYITLLSAFATLLHRFCSQDEMVIGVPIANRTRQELEPLIGFFLNTLPLRLDLHGEPTFRALLQRIKRVAFSAYAHQELPFEKLVEELRPDRSLGHSPLIDTAFVLDNNPGGVDATRKAGNLRLTRRVIDTGTAKFDLAMMLFRRDGGRR